VGFGKYTSLLPGARLKTRSLTVIGFGYQAGTIFLFIGKRFLQKGELAEANSAY
jgi:hypothetical protein